MIVIQPDLGKLDHDLTNRPKPIDDGEWIRESLPFYGRKIQVSEIFNNSAGRLSVSITNKRTSQLELPSSSGCELNASSDP